MVAEQGNEFFCEVDEEYIQDDFNLSGLSQQVPYYDYALDQILDMESPNEEILTEEQNEMVQSAAEMLYGLIHQRYILSSRGMQAMLEKFRSHDFGTCPRVFCNSQPCLPVGQSDIPRNSTVKVFCPKCEDIYLPRTRLQSNVDGAYFGTTFPHLFLLTYLHLKPQKPCEHYVPRIFGFKVLPTLRGAPPCIHLMLVCTGPDERRYTHPRGTSNRSSSSSSRSISSRRHRRSICSINNSSCKAPKAAKRCRRMMCIGARMRMMGSRKSMMANTEAEELSGSALGDVRVRMTGRHWELRKSW